MESYMHESERGMSIANLYFKWGFTPLPIRPGTKRPFGNGWNTIPYHYSLDNVRISLPILWSLKREKEMKEGERRAEATETSGTRTQGFPAMELPWMRRGTGSKYYNVNIGVLCGKRENLLVLDIDDKHGGLDRWRELYSSHEPIDTFTVRTGGGGLHLYFNSDHCDGLKTMTSRYGFDIRYSGGQVLGPFSIHPETGREYVIIGGYTSPSHDALPQNLESVPPQHHSHSHSLCPTPQQCQSLNRGQSTSSNPRDLPGLSIGDAHDLVPTIAPLPEWLREFLARL